MLNDFSGADKVVYRLWIHRPEERDRWVGNDRAAGILVGSVYQYIVSVLRQAAGPDQGSVLGRNRICAAV